MLRNIREFLISNTIFEATIRQSLITPHNQDDLSSGDFLQHHFFRTEPMCVASSLLEDQLSVKGYMDLARTWMKDTTSLVATSLKSGRVIGVAVTRINSDLEKTNVYSRVQVLKGETLNQIMRLNNELIVRTSPYEKFGYDVYFRIYILCVHPSYETKDIETALLKACVQVAETLKMPAIGGIFTSGSYQLKAQEIGFQFFSEIRYSQWIVNNRVIFDDPGRGNYSAAFLGMLISTKGEPEEESQEN